MPNYGPKITTDGLLLALDAANSKSYPGTGTTWFDMSGNSRNATMNGTMSIANGYATLGTGNYATVPHDSTISSEIFGSTSDNVTLISWFRMNTFQNWASMINKATGGSWSNTTVGLWTSSTSVVAVLGSNTNSNPAGSSVLAQTSSVSTNTWYQAC